MCVLALAWHAHPRWRLVLAGNRDELHARPADPLARWDAPGHVLAGRDREAGGTWLGVSEEGRMAVVTNLRGYGMPAPDMASRGALVADLLTGQGQWSNPAPQALDAFNPFSLMFVDPTGLSFLTNRPHPLRAPLGQGVYGLSNGALDAPWPKTIALKGALVDWLADGARDPVDLFGALAMDTLPRVGLAPETPSDVPLEPPLSPIFIRQPVYGTRCSTVVAVDAGGQGIVAERRFDPHGAPSGDTILTFAWPG